MKIIKNPIFTFILGIVLCTATAVTAYVIASIDVSYDNSISKAASDNAQGAIDELYEKAAYGTATAADILPGKSALVKGKKVNGSYVTPSIVLYYTIGSNNGTQTKQQTRITMNVYASLYKYYKILAANTASASASASGIYFNSECDQASGNMSLNTQYSTTGIPTLNVYTTGQSGAFWTVAIQLYN